MISTLFRFRGHGSLRYVYKNGRQVRNKHMVLKWAPNRRRSQPRISVVVSKKTHKSAVGRNRIRRRVYEILRHELPDFSLDPTADIVVIILSAETRTLPSLELYRGVRQLCIQAGLYKNRH